VVVRPLGEVDVHTFQRNNERRKGKIAAPK
jgi:hypothetical protein